MMFSVCIPVYNTNPTYLEHAVLSALKQAVDCDVELIISDNHSEIDYRATLPILKDRRIKYYRQEHTSSMVDNWNQVVNLSSGDFAILLCSDDVLLPGMFASYKDVFDRHEDISLCSCSRIFINESGAVITPRLFPNDREYVFRSSSTYIIDGKHAVKLSLSNGNIIGEPSAVMFRRSSFDLIGGYDSSYNHAADIDFNLRMTSTGKVAYINKPYLARRRHGNNLTLVNLSDGTVSRERVRLFNKFIGYYNFTSNEVGRFQAYLALKSIFDAVRSVRTHRWSHAMWSFKYFCSLLLRVPVSIARYSIDVLRKRNADAFQN